MSDREALKSEIKRLALNAGFSLKQQPDGTMDLNPYVYAFADAVFRQAAQAQAGSVTKNQISESIFGWGLRNDDGHNLSMDDTDEIAEYIMKQAAQAQAGKPVAAVHGWFHDECVIRALDPEAVLTVGMALYSQPQAHAGDGEPVGIVYVYGSELDGRHGRTFSWLANPENIQDGTKLYTAPPAAVNQQLLESELTGEQWSAARKVFEQYANKLNSADKYEMASAYLDAAPQAIYDAIAAAQEQPRPAVNQQLLELETYDAGYLNDFGGGNVSWWHDYIRSELGRAHDFYSSQIAAAQEHKP